MSNSESDAGVSNTDAAPRRKTVQSDSDSESDRHSVKKPDESDGNDGDLSSSNNVKGGRGRARSNIDLGLSSDSDDDSDAVPEHEASATAAPRGPNFGAGPAGGAAAAGAADDAAPTQRAGRGNTIGDLFGDSDRESGDDEGVFDERSGVRAGSGAGGGGSGAMSDDSEGGGMGGGGGGGSVQPRDRLRIPSLPRPRSGAEVFVAKLPKFLGMQARAFDPMTFDAEREAEDFAYAQNVIRWRHRCDGAGKVELGPDGAPVIETNTRLVKWDDGTMQLIIGGDAWDVAVQPNDRAFLFVHHKNIATGETAGETAAGTAAASAAVAAAANTCLECQGRLPRKMAFKPGGGLTSKAHQNVATLVRSDAAASQRGRGVMTTDNLADPEALKRERIVAEEEARKHERRRRCVGLLGVCGETDEVYGEETDQITLDGTRWDDVVVLSVWLGSACWHVLPLVRSVRRFFGSCWCGEDGTGLVKFRLVPKGRFSQTTGEACRFFPCCSSIV
ncbi:unnamed protein product [Phaeothamnion confervicola]